MIWIRGGKTEIGTAPAALADLLKGRSSWVRECFDYESPRHSVTLPPYYIGQYEVTNAQYHRYLQDQQRVYVVKAGGPRTLDDIASRFVRRNPYQWMRPDQRVWRQLYRANAEALQEVFTRRQRERLALRPYGLKERASTDGLRYQVLPYGLELKFYPVRPPRNWPDMAPPKGEEDHPVRFVSFDEAERFAEWAGMHIPSEQEWEWAARGPHAPRFPWGDTWVADTRHANWGEKIRDASQDVTTLAVDTHGGSPSGGYVGNSERPHGDGRSWCGCHHMLGNVAEWTSSWFAPYDGSSKRNRFMGTWVKVIRGGGAADHETLVLRPACRNFIGSGPVAPPYPENRFTWVGLRLAAYANPAEDRLGPIARRAVGPNKLRTVPIDLDLERFAGAATRPWAASEVGPANHVYAAGRSRAIVIVPLRGLLVKARDRPTKIRVDKRDIRETLPGSVRRVGDLVRNSETRRPRLLLGVLHTDLGLDRVKLRWPELKTWRRGRPWAEVPNLVPGVCPPGTYLLSLWFGRLTLLDPSMRFVCFLPESEWGLCRRQAGRAPPEQSAASTVTLDAASDSAQISFKLPLGNLGAKRGLFLAIKARLRFEPGALNVAETWFVGN